MGINLNEKFTKKDLLALPHRAWDAEQVWWDALLIVPSRHKHDSGWAHIAVIGANYDGDSRGVTAEEIIAFPDDLALPAQSGLRGLPAYPGLRMDAYHPQGILRLWSYEYQFSIVHPVSSAEILLRRQPKVES